MTPDILGIIPLQEIQKRGYEIWQRENRPQGKDLEHWFRAQAELAAELDPHVQNSEIQHGDKDVYFWDHYG